MEIKEKITDNYIKDLLVRMAHHSTAIEGNSLTQGETSSILISGYIPRDMSEREYYEVKNYKKAFEYLLDNDEKMSPTLIKNYHKIIMNNLRDDAGNYKKTENIILGADFEPTKPYQIPLVLQEWCDNFNYRIKNSTSNKEKVQVILEEHIKFERIHPFGDGNGRTGRMLILDSCMKENILPIIIPKEEKNKYISFLETENYEKFTEWGLELQEVEKKKIDIFFDNKKENNPWEQKIKTDKEKGLDLGR